jgi:hypothetical protein
MIRTRALQVRAKGIGADAAPEEMHFEEAASVMTTARLLGASLSSNAVSGRSIFGTTDTAATAISANREATRSRADI